MPRRCGLAPRISRAFRLSDHVMPVLEELTAKTGGTTSFYVRNGDERLCLFRVESNSRIRMTVQPGDSRPMDKSAIAETLRRYESGPPLLLCSQRRGIGWGAQRS